LGTGVKRDDAVDNARQYYGGKVAKELESRQLCTEQRGSTVLGDGLLTGKVERRQKEASQLSYHEKSP